MATVKTLVAALVGAKYLIWMEFAFKSGMKQRPLLHLAFALSGLSFGFSAWGQDHRDPIKSVRLDDFRRLEESSTIDQKDFKSLFRNEGPLSIQKLRVAQGPGTSGGGDVVKCGIKKWHLFGSNQEPSLYLADTYSLFKNGLLEKGRSLPEEIWMESVFQGLNKSSPGLGELVRDRLKHLKFVASPGPLDDLPDDQISLDGTDCSAKKQLAIQDLESGVVRVDFDLLKQLSYQEVYYFKIHEALISLKKTVEDTSPIRSELRGAVEKIVLQDIIAKVMNGYIDIPYTSKMLGVLKSLQAHQVEFGIYQNCKSKNITDDQDCLIFLLGQKLYEPGGYAGEAQISYAARLMANLGFENLPNKTPLRAQMQSFYSNILNFSVGIAGYLTPRISIVKLDDVIFSRTEEVHLAIINEIRKLQTRDDWSWEPGLVHWLNEDMNRFRQEYQAKTQSQDVPNTPYDTPRDLLEVQVGDCYGTYHRGLISAQKSGPLADYKIFGGQFLNCQIQKNGPLHQQNRQHSLEYIRSALGHGLEKDFDQFSTLFANLFKSF